MEISGLVVATYLVTLILLALYGFHRSSLVFLYYRHRDKHPRAPGAFADLPAVTVQLPLFNEMYVVERLLDAVAEIRYPRDRFQVQVLDRQVVHARLEQRVPSATGRFGPIQGDIRLTQEIAT